MSVEQKLLHFVSIDTQSDESSQTIPSTMKQKDLAKVLEKICIEIGFDEVFVSSSGIVYATLYGQNDLPSVGFCAHMDTATELTGANVRPRRIKEYDGKTIRLNDQYSMSPEDFPVLKTVIGHDLIVTDGNTLLGGDDKAGIAIILQAVQEVIREGLPHGNVVVVFTVDEEIGRGTDHFELDRFQVDHAYTVDGSRIDNVEYENFNAAKAVITFTGTSIHPGEGKGKLINASLAAMDYAKRVPNETPYNTEGRQGFYHLVEMKGSVEQATLVYLIRDHRMDRFENRKQILSEIVGRMDPIYRNTVSIQIQDQYYNMDRFFEGDPATVERAKAAIRAVGYKPVSIPVRGGTDGAMLSAKGCFCPNLGTGTYHHHGRYEFASIRQMEQMVQILKHIMII